MLASPVRMFLGLAVLSLLPGRALGGAPPSSPTAKPTSPVAHAEPVLSRSALRDDLRRLVALLDQAHPDPYQAVGGRVAFHRMAHHIAQTLPEDGMTAHRFLRRVRPLVAAVRDGHTTIRAPRAGPGSREKTWIELDAASRALFVSGVHASKDEAALGGLVVAVEGVPFAELVRRQQTMLGFDNDYNNLAHLIETLGDGRGLADILERAEPPDRARIELMRPDGSRAIVEAVVSEDAPGEAIRPASHAALPPVDAADLAWGFLDDRHEVALLRIDSCMRYREAFEVWRTYGFSTNLEEHLREVATAAAGGTPPEGVDARIAIVPSATEVFGALFAAMRREHTSTLLVDLRRNQGGNSAIAGILLYFMYGEEALREPGHAYQIPRFSDLFFENNTALDQTAFLDERGIQLGEYDFAGEDGWSRRMRGAAPATAGSDLEDYAALPTFYEVLKAGTVRPFAPPRVVVLTSARTYSAGFDLAASLYQRGARIAGVPSAQAGNCFIDSLGYELTNSRLRGSISYKRSLLFPGDPKAGEELTPDVELTYAAWAARGFDPDAAVTLALERHVAPPAPEASDDPPVFVWDGELDGVLPWLKRRYDLDGVVVQSVSELDRLTALRDWVHGRWEHDGYNQPRRFDALSILEEAAHGQRFRCVEYALVLAQVYRAMGYRARFVRLQGDGGAHAVTEVFAPELGKWVLMDGQHAAHVSRDGTPLSAVELRDAVARGSEGALEAHVDGAPIDYLAWVKGMLDYVMVPRDVSYGHELDELIVLAPEGEAAPRKQPAYLRSTRYVTTHDRAALDEAPSAQ
jgi:transglutaminase-like putative cysteine protease